MTEAVATKRLSESTKLSEISKDFFEKKYLEKEFPMPGDKLPDGNIYFGASPDTGEELVYSPKSNTFGYFIRNF